MNSRSSVKVIADSISNNGDRVTTLELEYPRYIHAETLTHRTFCLDGDSVLEFELPSGSKNKKYKRVYTLTLKEFANKWFEGDSKNRSLRLRLSNMMIRQLNEESKKIETCKIRDCIISGNKEVFEITTISGLKVGGSKDHRILTTDGWKTISELVPNKDYIITRSFGKLDSDVINPLDLKKINGSWKSTWLNQIREKKLEDQDRCCYDCGADLKVVQHDLHHVIPIYQDSSKAFEYENIVALCKDCHKDRHKIQGWQGGTYLYGKPELLIDVTSIGEKPTYDLEMDSKYENFIANGIVVHNSRNAQSSRAIPVHKLIERVEDDKWYPIFMLNQAGMAAEKYPDDYQEDEAKLSWDLAKIAAIEYSKDLVELGIHKQIVNRLLEPFSKIKVILTSTSFSNFFALRIHPSAQQEIQELAALMKDSLDNSLPERLDVGQWHLPYLREEERVLDPKEQVKLSVARCARVSYLSHDGKRDIDRDFYLHDQLLSERHMSPFEHACTPGIKGGTYANFNGWIQYRYFIEKGWTLK